MDLVTIEQLSELAADQPGPCVSLYLPTLGWGGSPAALREELLRHLQDAETRLAAAKIEKETRRGLFEPLARLVERETLGVEGGDGVALFARPGMARVWTLPTIAKPVLRWGDEFYLLPFAAHLQGLDHLYVLSLGQDLVRLYQAGESSIHEMTRADFPLHYDLSATPAPPWDTAAREGRGAEAASEAMNRMSLGRDLRQIDGAVHRALGAQRAPLVLAGVGYWTTQYESINTYSQVAPGKVPGAPELWTVDELRARAWRLALPWFAQQRAKSAAALARAAANGWATSDPAAIRRAAERGEVETLLVDEGAAWRGGQEEGLGEDALNYAAVKTWAHGGAVAPVAAETAPRGAAAVLRR